MKKLFLGLLVVAAGTGAFFLLRKKNESNSISTINKEWITGKWSTGKDSSGVSSFDFQKDGQVIRYINDSVRVDTSWYDWNKNNDLVWKEKATDSTGKLYAVLQLTNDSLKLRGADSAVLLFTKKK